MLSVHFKKQRILVGNLFLEADGAHAGYYLL